MRMPVRFLCLFVVLLGIVSAVLGRLQYERRRHFSAGRGAVISLSETITHEGGLSEWTRRLLVKSDATNDVEAIWVSAGRPDVFVRIWQLENDSYNICAYERVLGRNKEIFSNIVRIKERNADNADEK